MAIESVITRKQKKIVQEYTSLRQQTDRLKNIIQLQRHERYIKNLKVTIVSYGGEMLPMRKIKNIAG